MKTKKVGPTPAVAAPHPKGLAPFPFQLDAHHRVTNRLLTHRASYLAADPGLGKTILACLISNSRNSSKSKPLKVLYVCPPSLVSNVQAEFEKWGLHSAPRIVGDTALAKLGPVEADLAFVDEAHRFKNEKAQRTKALFRVLSKVPKIVFLSGTPMPNNRPVELWTILKHFAPDVFGTQFFPYALKYCGAHKTPWGWKFDKFTNKEDFKARLFKSFMVRQKKALLNLPPKREGLLTVGEGVPPIIGNLEAKVLKAYSKEDLLEGRLAKREGKAALHLSEYLRLLGPEKLKHLYPFIDHLIYDTTENVLFFAHHKAVIEALAQYLSQFKPVVITGATPVKKRHALVQQFQAGKTRFGILNIVAGGIGWNMVNADRVLMVEFSWRDGDNTQAGDRADRIGRTKSSLLIQYVVLKDTFDAKRMGVVLGKRHGAV